MNLQEFLSEAEQIERDGTAAITAAADPDSLEAARIAFLGDRQGRVKALQESLRGIAKEDKPAAGKRFNDVRTRLEALLDERRSRVTRRSDASREDLTFPGRRQWRGAILIFPATYHRRN